MPSLRCALVLIAIAALTACGSDSGRVTGPPPDPCTVRTPYTVGTTTNGTFTATDCRSFDRSFLDSYATTVSTAGAYVFSETSTAFDTYLYLNAGDGSVIAENDDISDLDTNSSIKVLLPAGSYVIRANAFDSTQTGAYTLASAKVPESIENCEQVFAARGITTAPILTTTDCVNNGFYSDDVIIFLPAGQSMTVSMNSTAFDAYVEIYSRTGLVASNDNKSATSTDAEVTFTAPVADYYLISPSTKLSGTPGATGAYTMMIK